MSSERPPELRKIHDARALRALAHPVRVALLEELRLHGVMTATEVGERIGETPTTCSFHLRQLAKYGFVEEAGGGKGRARPWRTTAVGLSISPDDQETQLATDAVVRVFRERSFARYQEWQRAKAGYPREWRKAAEDSQYSFYATATELRQLNDEVHALLIRFYDRIKDPSKRPPGATLVETMLMSFPVERPTPTEAGDSASDDDSE